MNRQPYCSSTSWSFFWAPSFYCPLETSCTATSCESAASPGGRTGNELLTRQRAFLVPAPCCKQCCQPLCAPLTPRFLAHAHRCPQCSPMVRPANTRSGHRWEGPCHTLRLISKDAFPSPVTPVVQTTGTGSPHKVVFFIARGPFLMQVWQMPELFSYFPLGELKF